MNGPFPENFWNWDDPIPDGTPFVRDERNPCHHFEPREGADISSQNTCMTDGHYLCVECKHIAPLALASREHPFE